MSWMDEALCRGSLEWLTLTEPEQIERCPGCPVRFDCLNVALSDERGRDIAAVDEHPVYGGLTGKERKQILYRQRRKSAAQDSDFPTVVEDCVYLAGVA